MKNTGIAAVIMIYSAMSCSKKNSGSTANPAPVTPKANAEITIQTADAKQTIQGFGCATVFNPPNTAAITSQEFDNLFNSGDGQVGLNILRIRVAPDGDVWRTTELNYAKEAINRGAKVMATPWSPPARMKTNNNLIGGRLITDSSAAYARYLNDFALYMAANGAPLHVISVQNEPDIQVSYEGCEWTADEMLLFLKNYGHLVTATRLMAPESFQNNQNFVNTILSDDVVAANIDIVGGHIYGGGIVENALAKSKGKEVWMTEHLDTLISYPANLNTAIEIHNCFTKADFNAYIWWYGKRFYSPIGQDGAVTKRGFIISQFAKFIKPGSIRLSTSANSRSDVLISAYKNGSKKIIVAVNNSYYEVDQKITIIDASLTEIVPYTTTEFVNVQQGPKITASSNSFNYKLPPYSVTTFIEP